MIEEECTRENIKKLWRLLPMFIKAIFWWCNKELWIPSSL